MKIIDKLIANMLKYAQRPEWNHHFMAIWAGHIQEAAKVLDMDEEEVSTFIEESGYHSMLYGVVFEDFMGLPNPETNGTTFAAAYLKKAGWREPPRARKYLKSLAETPLSLYEVLEVHRDRGLLLQDMLREEPPVFVKEKSATHHTATWDILAARVVDDLQHRVLTGGLLLLDREGGMGLANMLRENPSSIPVTRSPENSEILPIMVTTVWLSNAIAKTLQPLPELHNRDGHKLLFSESRLPLRASTETLRALLDATQDWLRSDDTTTFWSWVANEDRIAAGPDKGLTLDTLLDGEHPVLGSAELKEDYLLFTTNSRERTKQGLARLAALLGDAVGNPITLYETPEAMLEKAPKTPKTTELPFSDAEIEAIRLQAMDRHYREIFSQAIPALGNRSPREAVATPEGRSMVIDWLKLLENHEAKRANRAGGGAYDFTWMWGELGLETERH